VDGFMGAQPEGKLREFLDKHLPSEGELAAEAEADEAHQLLEAGDTQAALQKLADALAADPANDDARFDYVRLLIATGGYEEAGALLAEPLKRIPQPTRFEALNQWLQCMLFVQNDERGNWEFAQFDEVIAQNRRDFGTRFGKAQALAAEGQWAASMDELLTPPKPKKQDAIPGKSSGGIELLGKGGAEQDEATQLVNGYRRKLSMALN
jgi:putative thioredoxin